MSPRKVVMDAVSAASGFASLPTEGAAQAEVRHLVVRTWREEAACAGVNVKGLDPNASLAELIAWARANGLLIATVLSRYSTKMQHSTEAQVVECVKFAARNRMFVIPQFVCVDEAEKGRKVNRHAIKRMKAILERQLVDVLLVFKLSRLFRKPYEGYRFIEQECVERGIRAVAVTQGVDTNDKKTWKQMCCLHGLSDEMLLDAISDHVRSGLNLLFRDGYVTGALPVGYVAKEVPGGRPTKLGKPRTMPSVDADVAALIRKHFEFHRDGMPITTGWKLWIQAGGPCDPRSTTGRMTRPAYRRMLRNVRYTGRWAFGRKRNVWSSKLDYTKQEVQPDTEVSIVQSEELRIVSDELFFAVQARLEKNSRGVCGPKGRQRPAQLWDVVTKCFVCSVCSKDNDARFYHYGSNNRSMVCRNLELCPCMTAVMRKEAVEAVLGKLCELIDKDGELVSMIVANAQQIDAIPDGELEATRSSLCGRIAAQTRRIGDLFDIVGSGNDQDRAETKAQIRHAQAQRCAFQAELATIEQKLEQRHKSITPDDARAILAEFRSLLTAAGAGKLGDDLVYRAAHIFELLVGGRVLVCVEPRPGRKRTVVRGKFTPRLLAAVSDQLSSASTGIAETHPEVAVWLRRPPKCDDLAFRVHELVDGHGLSYGEAADELYREGHGRMSAVRVSILYTRYYEIVQQPRPRHAYNHGRPRKTLRSGK